MKCDKCGYDDNGSGDTAHACTFYQSLSQPVKTPQRTWIGLTPQERDEINQQVFGIVPHYVAFHHAIEAKLKEKNT